MSCRRHSSSLRPESGSPPRSSRSTSPSTSARTSASASSSSSTRSRSRRAARSCAGCSATRLSRRSAPIRAPGRERRHGPRSSSSIEPVLQPCRCRSSCRASWRSHRHHPVGVESIGGRIELRLEEREAHGVLEHLHLGVAAEPHLGDDRRRPLDDLSRPACRRAGSRRAHVRGAASGRGASADTPAWSVGIARRVHDPSPQVVGPGGELQRVRSGSVSSLDHPSVGEAALSERQRLPVPLMRRSSALAEIDSGDRPRDHVHVAHDRRSPSCALAGHEHAQRNAPRPMSPSEGAICPRNLNDRVNESAAWAPCRGDGWNGGRQRVEVQSAATCCRIANPARRETTTAVSLDHQASKKKETP